MRVAWYRLRATFAHQWSGLLTVVLLIGLLGGLAIGSVGAARRTSSSFDDFAASTHVPSLFVLDGVYNPTIGLTSGYNPALLRTIAHLPHVASVQSDVEVNVGPVLPNGDISTVSLGLPATATVNGLDFVEDRVIVPDGRMLDPAHANEIVLDSATAKAFGLHLGSVAEFGWLTNAQGNSVVVKVPRDQRIRVKVVGVGAVRAQSLFQDENTANNSTIELVSPALSDKLLRCCTSDMLSGLTISGGTRNIAAVESEVRAVLPKGLPFTYVQLSDVLARAHRTLRPEAIALGVFGGIAGLAALLITGQVVGRRIRQNREDTSVLRALGATPAMTMSDGLIGTLGAILAGSLLAGAVGIALSPLAPLGPVRPYLAVGLHVDGLVVWIGVAILLVSLSALAVVVAYRATPHRSAEVVERVRASGVAHAAMAAGMPPSTVVGVRFALEPGAGRNAVPVRSAILGAILALVVVVTTVTFGASMNTLVSHPALFGWNWTAEIDGGGGLGDVPGNGAARLLGADPYVAAWTGIYFSTLSIDGQNIPVMGTVPRASVAPPLLSGHALEGTGQVVFGAATMRQLHKRVGDTVEVRIPGARQATLTIVGTATLPSIGVAGSSHLEMGQGALLSYSLIPPAQRNIFDVPQPGPNAILVRLKPGADQSAGFRSLESIGNRLHIVDNGGAVAGVQRPAEILTYRSLGATPVLLGAALAAGAVVALALTLVASVRRRRRDLALLKTLGFTRRQLALAIAWQATVAVSLGCVIGVPLGIALGRWLWDLFARGINAVPDPTVPVASVIVIVAAALVLANIVAAVPGRIAARTPTARLLRAE